MLNVLLHQPLSRIDRLFETTLATQEGFVNLSQIALLLSKLDRSQLFNTP
jgi:hypothetical protein